jgi:hypothetical protein
MNAETLIVALMAFGSPFFKACFLDYAILHDQVHRIDLTRFALRCVEEL